MLQNGEFLDSCMFLGTDSSYSAFEHDNVRLVGGDNDAHLDSEEDKVEGIATKKNVANGPVEFVIELQVQSILLVPSIEISLKLLINLI